MVQTSVREQQFATVHIGPAAIFCWFRHGQYMTQCYDIVTLFTDTIASLSIPERLRCLHFRHTGLTVTRVP